MQRLHDIRHRHCINNNHRQFINIVMITTILCKLCLLDVFVPILVSSKMARATVIHLAMTLDSQLNRWNDLQGRLKSSKTRWFDRHHKFLLMINSNNDSRLHCFQDISICLLTRRYMTLYDLAMFWLYGIDRVRGDRATRVRYRHICILWQSMAIEEMTLRCQSRSSATMWCDRRHTCTIM